MAAPWNISSLIIVKILVLMGIKTNLREVKGEWFIYQCFDSEKGKESK